MLGIILDGGKKQTEIQYLKTRIIMKTNFTLKSVICVFAQVIVLFAGNAQTSHNVTAQNFGFSPSILTINVGDTVIWTNNEGTHNVNGTQASYPSNPASFGNNVGSGWTYTFVFKTAGTYDYHCSPHRSAGMTGKVIVEEKTTTFISSKKKIETILSFPNPAVNFVSLHLSTIHKGIVNITITNMNGQLVQSEERVNNTGALDININNLQEGVYFITIKSKGYSSHSKFIKIN